MFQAWLLLALLRALSVASEALNCTTSDRTVQLNRTHVLRTWQPDGACPWLENRWSETDKFPAAVRSGPRWLVMQLRRPMMLERVSVQSWGGEWQTAGAVGSHVSAVGASSLPLELQLEDPCRASWDAIGRSGGWRQLGEAVKTPVSFILLNSSQQLEWMSLNLTGRVAPLQLSSDKRLSCSLNNLMQMSNGDPVCFHVTVCDPLFGYNSAVECAILNNDNGTFKLASPTEFKSQGLQHYAFEFVSNITYHGSMLTCWQGQMPARRVEKILQMRVSPKEVRMSVAPVWVSGRSVTVNFTTVESFPEPQHLCWIGSVMSEWNFTQKWKLNATSTSRKVVKNSRNQPVITMWSQFKFKVAMYMRNKSVMCEESIGDKLKITSSKRIHQIVAVSEPCVTHVDLGTSSRHWPEGEVREIRVTSRNCSIWNASHSCWLIHSDGTSKQNKSVQLRKIKQQSFISIHQLPVSRLIGQRDWLVRCRVNQSGVVYDDVESQRNYSTINNDGAINKGTTSGINESSSSSGHDSDYRYLLNALVVFGIVVLFTYLLLILAIVKCNIFISSEAAPIGSSEYQLSSLPGTDNLINEGHDVQQIITVSTTDVSCRSQQPAPKFVTVVKILTTEAKENHLSDSDPDYLYQEATGHYEPDGCTFVQYKLAPVDSSSGNQKINS